MRFFYGCHLNTHDFATERLLASTRGRGRGRKKFCGPAAQSKFLTKERDSHGRKHDRGVFAVLLTYHPARWLRRPSSRFGHCTRVMWGI